MLTITRPLDYRVIVNMTEFRTADLPARALGAGVVKRPTRLADGRELIYFDDADTTLGAARAVDARALDPRPETATMRQDILTGDWVSVAAARQNRAFLPPAELDPLAPQTSANPSEIPSVYDVAVFENRSPSFGPALLEDAADPPHGLDDLAHLGLGRTRTSVGRCEVVCFSPEHTGSFVIAIVAQLAAACLYLVALRPDPLVLARGREVALAPAADAGIVRGRSALVFAIGTIALSHAVMVSIMAMTPVHMTSHGASLTIVGFTISLHIAGMYALSPLFGWASDRFGRLTVILAGQGMFAVSVLLIGTSPENTAAVTVALVLLGLGWSASTVSGSALVSDLVTGEARVRVQGRTDTIMSLAGAVGGASAGPVLALLGYAGVAWAAGALVLVILLASGVMGRRVATVR